MTFNHVRTVNRFLRLEIGYASDMGPAGLSEAIIEALAKAGVLAEANVIYLKTSAPGELLAAVDIWVPEEEEPDAPPPLPLIGDCCLDEDHREPERGCCSEGPHPNV